MLFSSVIGGFLSDRLGRRKPLVIGSGTFAFFVRIVSLFFGELQIFQLVKILSVVLFFSNINECLCCHIGWITGEVCFLCSNASGLDFW